MHISDWRRQLATSICATLFLASVVRGDQLFQIQAHRGAGIARSENTLESFKWAWGHGVTPEADLRTTKDGTIVCFHDTNFARVVKDVYARPKQLGIEELPLAEVQKFDVGTFRGKEFAGQRIPTLASVFAEMRGKPERLVYLDIKTVDLDQLATMVREYDVESQGIFTTTNYELIQKWRKLVPTSLTLLWNGGTEAELAAKMDTLRKSHFGDITHLQIHVHVGDLDSKEPFTPSSRFLRDLGKELTNRGIIFQVLPWECSDPRAYAKLLALGAKSFATDYPEVTLKAVHDFRAGSHRGDSK